MATEVTKSFLCRQGDIRYGTVEFPTLTRCSLQSETVLSSNGVNAMYRLVTVRIEADFIYGENPNGGTTVDSWSDAIMDILNKPRQTFKFESQGYGETFTVRPNESTVSGESTDRIDRNGGPIPRVVSWTPLISNKAYRLVWECDVHLSLCESTLLDYTDFSYERDFNISPSGAMVVTTKGQANLLKSFTGVDSSVTDIGSIRDIVTTLFSSSPWGFHREFDFREDESGTRLDFTVTDTEIESDNPFMPYMFNMDVSHRIRSQTFAQNATDGMGLRSWLNTLSGSIEIPKGIPRVFAWMAFLAVYRERVTTTRDPDDETSGETTAEVAELAKSNFAVLGIEIEEPIYGRDFKFVIEWLSVCDLDELFEKTNIFSPVTAFTDSEEPPAPLGVDAQWRAWEATVETRLMSGYGSLNKRTATAKLVFDPCTTTEGEITTGALTGTPITDVSASALDSTEGDKEGIDVYPTGATLQEEKSWVDYRNKFGVIRDVETVVYDRVADVEPSKFQDDVSTVTSDALKGDKGMTLANITSDPMADSPVVARTKTVIANGEDKFTIVMKGSAMRVGYKIPQPALLSANGNDVYPVGRQYFEQERIMSSNDQPIYKAQWRLTYAVDGHLFSDDLMTQLVTTGDVGRLT